MQLQLRVNGSVSSTGPLTLPTNFAGESISDDLLLAVGDKVTVYCTQDSAGNEATQTGASGTTRFAGHLVHKV